MILFAVTHVGRDGLRVLSRTAQGRDMFQSREAAEVWMREVLENTPPDTIRQVWGPNALGTFEVRECECWDGHGDPRGIYFDD